MMVCSFPIFDVVVLWRAACPRIVAKRDGSCHGASDRPTTSDWHPLRILTILSMTAWLADVCLGCVVRIDMSLS